LTARELFANVDELDARDIFDVDEFDARDIFDVDDYDARDFSLEEELMSRGRGRPGRPGLGPGGSGIIRVPQVNPGRPGVHRPQGRPSKRGIFDIDEYEARNFGLEEELMSRGRGRPGLGPGGSGIIRVPQVTPGRPGVHRPQGRPSKRGIFDVDGLATRGVFDKVDPKLRERAKKYVDAMKKKKEKRDEMLDTRELLEENPEARGYNQKGKSRPHTPMTPEQIAKDAEAKAERLRKWKESQGGKLGGRSVA
jgi:hypothetical protein